MTDPNSKTNESCCNEAPKSDCCTETPKTEKTNECCDQGKPCSETPTPEAA